MLPRNPLSLSHTKWQFVRSFVVHSPHGSLSSCHEWMSLRCWTPGSQVLYLLHNWFWWPGMAAQMQKVISSCKWCIQHEGSHTKGPMWPIIVTTLLELLCVDFTSIETMMESDQPPNVVSLLVFCDHFMKHVMVYVTPNQMAKTVAKFLLQGYILIFRAPVKLLSNWGASFESNIIRELCELIGIQKVRTSSYHVQANGQVEWAHQTLMHMIGKLSKDWMADWLRHLSKSVYAYSFMRAAIARYSSHYLMFGCWPHLPINFYLPTIRDMKTTSMLTIASPSYMNDCEKPLKRLKCSPHQRWRDRSGTTIGKLMLFHRNQVT